MLSLLYQNSIKFCTWYTAILKLYAYQNSIKWFDTLLMDVKLAISKLYQICGIAMLQFSFSIKTILNDLM